MIKKDLLSNLSRHIRSTMIGPTQQSLNRFANHDMTPLATMFCQAIEDVQTAIKYCNDKNIAFTIKSSGSNQACSSIKQNSLILDLSPLKKVSHIRDKEKMTLKFQGGVNFHDIQGYLSRHNTLSGDGFAVSYPWLRNISGIGAHTVMGNGILQRKCGVGVDLIKSAQLVLASGEIIFADKANNPDLLWAVKGSATNIGAVLEVTEELPEQTCNVMDPQAGKEIRMYSTSFPMCDKTSKIGKDLSNHFQSLSADVLPYTMFIMSKKFSSVMLLNYQTTYDKQLKKINSMPNHNLEQQLKHMIASYDGKSHYQGGFIYETVTNTQLKVGPKKNYYKLWGGSTTISQVPCITEEIVKFYLANPLDKFDDSSITIASNIIYLDSPSFRSRDPASSSWPNSKEENIVLYGSVSYSNKQLHPQCNDYLNRLEGAMKKYMKFGSVCDCNYPITDPNLAKWVYGHNYSKLKQIKKKYDPLNRFGHGLFSSY